MTTWLQIDHVQLAIPTGQEAAARRFYVDLLGLREQEKPESLRSRGGAWFEGGSLRLHVGVEENFRPSKKAHPGLLLSGLSALVERLRAANVPVEPDAELPGYARVYVTDPFGNRLELLERKAD
jgi:catechol 2,3-dioxygenase-like lactoylglutathione lyase family enzyme